MLRAENIHRNTLRKPAFQAHYHAPNAPIFQAKHTMEWDDCAPTYQASQNLRYTRWVRFLTKQAPSQLPNCAPSHKKSPGKSNTLLRNLPDKQEHHTKYNNQPFHPSSLSFLSLLASQQTVLYDELSVLSGRASFGYGTLASEEKASEK